MSREGSPKCDKHFVIKMTRRLNKDSNNADFRGRSRHIDNMCSTDLTQLTNRLINELFEREEELKRENEQLKQQIEQLKRSNEYSQKFSPICYFT